MGNKRQKTQLELAFPTEGRGEAPRTVGEGTELSVANHDPQSPASSETLNHAEPPCTDPGDRSKTSSPKYAWWCDRESPRGPTYVDFPGLPIQSPSQSWPSVLASNC